MYIDVYLRMMGRDESNVIHIRTHNGPLGSDKDSSLCFWRARSLRTRNTLYHSMGERKRRQILEIMLSMILEMCR
jgi:hypothetical protein